MNDQDRKNLKKIIQESLMEFWDKVLEPPLSRLYKRVDALDKKVGNLDKKVGNLEEDVRDIKETLTRMKDRVDDVAAELISHEKRLIKVERKLSFSI